MSYHKSFLTTDLLIRYKELMDSAEQACFKGKGDYSRVKKQRMAVDYAYLDVALNAKMINFLGYSYLPISL